MTLRRVRILLTVALAWGLLAPAQEAAKPHQARNTAESPQEKKEQRAAEAPATGPGAELAEASREAAGEEENAQFKQSGSVRWIASVTGLSLHSAYWLAVVLNFAIVALAIGIIWKLKVPAALRARSAAILKGMEEARQASEEARRRLGEIEQRLAKLDAEIAGMRASAEADAAAEEERVRGAAEDDKRKVIETAEQEIAAAARQARRELKAYAADLAVALAEKRIRVDANTDQALVRSFVEQLAEPDGSPRKESR